MKIRDLFRRPIDRQIEEVVKVDLAEEEIVASEIEEYVATQHIRENFERILDQYVETIRDPDQEVTVWVSGFFGSGKSSFAKVLGYLLANPDLQGRTATDLFLERVDASEIRALLNTAHKNAPTKAVFVDLSTGRDVLKEGEPIVLPVYRALLEAMGYSRNVLLAELEFDLESDGDLEKFVEAFGSLPDARGPWTERRHVGLAKGEASHAMHLLRPDTYPSADSWSKSAEEPEVSANSFAKRAVEILKRRGGGSKRLVFIVDEVGQYVARSVERMLDLQGLAQAVQKEKGQLWLVVTSQEKLDDVVESLEGKQIELARAQARFPIRVDLLPEDIDEVAGKRILDKNEPGQKAVREAYQPHKNKLASNVRLSSATRAQDLAEEEFVRLYPLLPYQIQLLIDAVDQRRAHGGAAKQLGGSNRTIIKHAQGLIVHHSAGLGNEEVGSLVTLDRSYDLLESIIPTSWQAEIGQLAERHGEDSFEVSVAKAIALTMDVRQLPLDVANLSVMLHPHVSAESVRDDVAVAVEKLVNEEVLRSSDEGYRLQSPEEKDWEKTRKGISPKPADAIRIRRQILRQALTGASVTKGRTFRIQVTVEGEKQIDGDIDLVIEEANEARREEIRSKSRESSAEATIWWVYDEAQDTYDAIEELYRSQQMIARKDVAAKSAEEIELLGEERNRLARFERQVVTRLSRDLAAGEVLFRGVAEPAPSGDVRPVAQQIVGDRVQGIYSRLEQFSANVKRADVLAVLRAEDLSGLPDYLGEDGIGLTQLTPGGTSLVVDKDPLAAVIKEISERDSYGNEATGAHLEKKFGAPPYGAQIEVVQMLIAAGIRAGAVEVVHQGARIRRADDQRLDKVLGTIPPFRAASFVPQQESIPIEARADVAEKLAGLTGSKPPVALDALATALRGQFAPDLEACHTVDAALRALGLPVPEAVDRNRSIALRVRDEEDEDVVRTAQGAWADLIESRKMVQKLASVVEGDMTPLRQAIEEVETGTTGLDESGVAEAEKLRDLLEAGDLADNMAEIKSLAQRLASTRQAAADAKLEELSKRVDERVSQLEERFGGVEESTRSEALMSLRNLTSLEGQRASLDVLAANLLSVNEVADRAERLLQEVASAGKVVRIQIRELFSDPITGEEDLEVALKRIREAVSAELGEDKQVWLT